ADDHPLVLAAVDYYLPLFKQASDHPAIADQAVAGNPDALSAAELHEAAWPVVAPIFDAGRHDAAARLHAAGGTGTTAADLDDVVLAAHDGQVDILFADPTRPVWGRV